MACPITLIAMATVDFKIVANTSVPGVTIVHSMNEEAFEFITDELQYGFLPNGDVAINSDDIYAFICEAEAAHLNAVIS